jgi:hypothetical protein
VLESEAEKWFSGGPLPSAHMLFNATLKSKGIPAITHVDGSARIQTVNKNDGAFYDLLVEFFEITGVPILLNTSFNGPGEPIVETPIDAVQFFIDSELDVLYLDSYKIKRKTTSKADSAKKNNPTESKKATALDTQKFMADIEKAQKQRLTTYFLVEVGYEGFNIVVFDGCFLGFRQSIGDVSHTLSVEALQERYAPEDVIVGDSVDAVRVQIDHLRMKPPVGG